jgi:cation-transporting ATPase E
MTILRLFHRNTETAAQRETSRSYRQILSANLFSFFNLILFAVGLILLAFGRYNDAFITVITAFVSAAIRTFQEVRAKRQLDQMALLVRPQATVIRDGKEETIDGGALVQGDLIHLRAGDQALADGVVVARPGARVAEVDESLLTGESDLVRKTPGDKIYSGSFCVTGDLLYQAEAVGAESFAHKLAASARVFTTSSTPLQQQISFVIRLLMLLTVVMALSFYIGGLLSGSTLLQYVTGSAVLVGLAPYGLFLTISLAHTLGAVTLARQGAIVQRTQAVESLQHVDVLCMDKTGTLTANALQLQTVQPLGQVTASEAKQLLGDFARSAAATNATSAAIRQGVEGRQRQVVDEAPFSSARKWSALAFDDEEGRGLFVLGALEMLQSHLATEIDAAALAQQAQAWADQGLRVLLFATHPTATSLHDAAGQLALPPLQPLALISLRDELRPYAREMINEFTRLGIGLKIISGDSPHTVAGLAQQVGLTEAKLVAGPTLAAMSGAEFAQAAEEATIFGRIVPEQKAQLVDVLSQHGHYVAMMGDGVNDILALKKAKLGIAMQSGSSATRSVADMVLLGDSYAALAPALTEGQRIINGLTNATYLLLARSFTYAFVIIGALMAGLPFPVEPAQTGVTTLTVGLPAFFLTLWARPQAKVEPLLPSLVRFVLPVAVWSMIIGVSVYAYVYFQSSRFLTSESIPAPVIARFEEITGLTYEPGEEFGLTAARISAQTALSTFLSLGALILILFLEPPITLLASWRSRSPDRRPAWLASGLTGLFVVGLHIPAVRNSFGFAPLVWLMWRDVLVGLAVWIGGLWLLWRSRWVDRLLAIHT